MVMQLHDEHDEDSIRLLSHTLSSTITAATSPSLSPTSSSSSPSNHRYQPQQNQDNSSHDHNHVVFLSSSFTSSSSHALLRALLLLCGVISLISLLSFGKDKGSRVTVDVVRMSGSVSMAVCPPASFTNETVKHSHSFGAFNSCNSCSSSSSPKSILQYPAAVVPTHTFLISFPRSGNSLLRRLLEHATGHLTGSVYGDKRLYQAGLRGEMDQEHVLLLKHHFLDFVDGRVDLSSVWTNDSANNPIPRFSRYVIHRYIYVVRDPIDALVSYWHFMHSNEMHEAVNPNVTLQAVTNHILYWIPIWAQHVRTFTSTFLLDSSRCQSCQMNLVKYEEIIEGLALTSPRPWMSRLLRFLHYPLHRPCAAAPPRSSSPSSSPFVTYAVKERQSLVTPERILARSESYAWEVLGRMNCSQLDWIERVAGLEMKAMGYWPEEISKIDNMGRRLCERNRNGASVGPQHDVDDNSIACSPELN